MAKVAKDIRLTPARVDELCCGNRMPTSNGDLRSLVVALSRELNRERLHHSRQKKLGKELKEEIEYLEVWRDHNSTGRNTGTNVQGDVPLVRDRADQGDRP